MQNPLSKDRGRGVEPQIVQVQLKGQLSMTSPNRAVLGWSPFQLKSTGPSIVQHVIIKRRQIRISKALYLKYEFQRLDGIF